MQTGTDNQKTQKIPIIDLGPYVNKQANTKQIAQTLRRVLKDVGFFYVKNHGMPKKLQDDMFKYMKSFFSLPEQEKNKIHMNKNQRSGMGYYNFKQELTLGKTDLKEGIYIGKILEPNHPKVIQNYPFHGNNFLPQSPNGFTECILEYIKQINLIGDTILQVIAQSLNLEKSYFKENVCKETGGCLSIMRYPCDVNNNPEPFSLGEHADYGFLVILMAGDKGLEVKNRQGEWIDVDPIEDTFIINVGDVLEKMTKNLYRSNPHRVRKPQGVDRYSVPYFYDPGWDFQMDDIQFELTKEEEQDQIIKKTREEKRVDNSKVDDLKGKYGKYLMKKFSTSFPLQQKYRQFYQREIEQEKKNIMI